MPLVRGNWGGYRLLTTQNPFAGNPIWEAFAEVTLDPDENNGFNITIRPPPDLVGPVFTETLWYELVYGGGGIANVTTVRSTRRPITLNVPGSYIRVQAYVAVDGGEPIGAQRQVNIFVTPYTRALRYPTSPVISFTIGPGLLVTQNLQGNSARGFYLLSHQIGPGGGGGGAMAPLNLEVRRSMVGWPGGANTLGFLYGVDTIVNTPFRLCDESVFISFENPGPTTAQVTLWFDEEL